MRNLAYSAAAVMTISALMTLFALSAAAKESPGREQTGIAACYSRRLVGHRTTSGQHYDPNALTAAHGTIAVGTQVKITNLENGKSVVVVVNDRMAKGKKIIMDVSQRVCKELEFGKGGSARVKLEVEPSRDGAATP